MAPWTRRLMICALAAGLGVVAVPASHADWRCPPATLRLSGTTIAVGIGTGWGTGVLTYEDETHKFRMSNVVLGALGLSRIEARGEIECLKSVADFNGTYVAAEAGIAIGGGASALTMKNQNSVVITLTSTQAGLNFRLGVGGVTLEIIE
jgi:hypothetical protein